jgi:hypothetical protein
VGELATAIYVCLGAVTEQAGKFTRKWGVKWGLFDSAVL